MTVSLTKYWLRILIFSIAIIVFAVLLYPQLVTFFTANIPINSLILAVFTLGVLYNLWILFRLRIECSWINAWMKDKPLPKKPLYFLKPIQAMTIQSKEQRVTPQNTQFIFENVEARLEENKAISRYLISLLVFLGLLGTFWGLMITTSSLTDIFSGSYSQTAGEDLIGTLLSQLSKPLSGMRTAFASSLFGLSASLVLGFIHLQVNQAENRFMLAIEDVISKITQWGEALEASPLGQVQQLIEQSQKQITALSQLTAGNIKIAENINASIDAMAKDMPAFYEHAQYSQQMIQNQNQILENLTAQSQTTTDPQKYYDNILHYIAKQLEQANTYLAKEDAEKQDLHWIELNQIKRLLEQLLYKNPTNSGE
ncbi:MAG: MotA/TolQ/ExbB proton channel family protein [Alphaproteobacteria bacterium]